MSKGPMAPSGSFDDLKDPCGLEHNEKEKHGEGELERWADTST